MAVSGDATMTTSIVLNTRSGPSGPADVAPGPLGMAPVLVLALQKKKNRAGAAKHPPSGDHAPHRVPRHDPHLAPPGNLLRGPHTRVPPSRGLLCAS